MQMESNPREVYNPAKNPNESSSYILHKYGDQVDSHKTLLKTAENKVNFRRTYIENDNQILLAKANNGYWNGIIGGVSRNDANNLEFIISQRKVNFTLPSLNKNSKLS